MNREMEKIGADISQRVSALKGKKPSFTQARVIEDELEKKWGADKLQEYMVYHAMKNSLTPIKDKIRK